MHRLYTHGTFVFQDNKGEMIICTHYLESLQKMPWCTRGVHFRIVFNGVTYECSGVEARGPDSQPPLSLASTWQDFTLAPSWLPRTSTIRRSIARPLTRDSGTERSRDWGRGVAGGGGAGSAIRCILCGGHSVAQICRFLPVRQPLYEIWVYGGVWIFKFWHDPAWAMLEFKLCVNVEWNSWNVGIFQVTGCVDLLKWVSVNAVSRKEVAGLTRCIRVWCVRGLDFGFPKCERVAALHCRFSSSKASVFLLWSRFSEHHMCKRFRCSVTVAMEV